MTSGNDSLCPGTPLCAVLASRTGRQRGPARSWHVAARGCRSSPACGWFAPGP